jgi:hypothetical protein
MKARTYHALGRSENGKDLEIQPFVDHLTGRGFKPLLRDTFGSLNSCLDSVGLPTFPSFVDVDEAEIFVYGDSSGVLLLRLVGEDNAPIRLTRRRGFEEIGANAGLDMILLSSNEDYESEMHQQLEEASKAALDIALEEHSLTEMRLIELLKRRFGELSPNGKLLLDLDTRAACRHLYDDEFRGRLKPIIDAFGISPAPRSGLEKLDLFVGQPEALDELLKDSRVATSHYSVACRGCGTSQLAFQDRSRADDVISSVDARCGACGERKLHVLDTFAFNESYERAIKQGLWLESLAADMLERWTSAVWAGQMARRDELDVVGIYAETMVLVECKDRNLGATDVYVTAAKAQNVGADLTILLTTSEVHQNVQDVIEEMSGAGREQRIELIAEPSVSGIKNQFEQIIEKATTRAIMQWMIDVQGYPFSPMRFIRA